MRLLNVQSREFHDYHFEPETIPRYVIASYRWERGTETTLDEFRERRGTLKNGYRKVNELIEYVKLNVPGVDWVWIDTCCIDGKNSQEVSTAINSMFRWYANAVICLVYLADVKTIDPVEIGSSDWWTRGWTLQELLAPRTVVFLTRGWQVIGHKGERMGTSLPDFGPSLETAIASFTGIPEDVLHDYHKSRMVSQEEKLTWASGRKTSREEDMSYCLLGLLDVAMVANYGEGGDKARRRLLKELSEASQHVDNILATHPVRTSFIGTSTPFERPVKSQDTQSLQRYILESLYFPQLEARRDQIDATYRGTFQWALQPTSTNEVEGDNLMAWLRDPHANSNVYWIHAKPGAGKSSLIRFLEENLEQSQHMQSWSRGSELILISYYFWSPGNILQKSLAGLLRSILYRLLDSFPEIMITHLPRHKSNRARISKASIDWTEIELRQYLRRAIPAVLSEISILFLFDGLDEIHGTDDDRDELISFLQELARYRNVRLCISSRHWTVFKDAFGKCPQLRLEDLNAGDIATYVQGQLWSQERFRHMFSYDVRVRQLIDEIIHKAKGVFLWTRLIVKELLRAIRDGEPPEALQRKIRDTPGDLNDYFRQIIDSIDVHHRSQACALLQITLHHESEWIQLSSLRLLDLIFLPHANTNFALSGVLEQSVGKLSDTNALIYILDSTLRMLSSRSKGLLECYFHQDSAFQGGPDQVGGTALSELSFPVITALRQHKNVVFELRIDFMHRSLRDFLLEPESQHFLHQHTAGPFDARNYLRNARLCQVFMCERWGLNTEAAVGLGSYVICTLSSPRIRHTSLGAHFARRFEPAMEYLLSLRNYIPSYWYISESFRFWDDLQSSFCTLAIDFAWIKYVNETLTSQIIQSKRGRPILDYILRPRFYSSRPRPSDEDPTFEIEIGNQLPIPELVDRVLSLGADPNERFQGIPIWSLFLSFVGYTCSVYGESEEVKSTLVATLAVMIKGGAQLSASREDLYDSEHFETELFSTFLSRWRQVIEIHSNQEEIPITDVLEWLRPSLGDGVDHLKSLVEQHRRPNEATGPPNTASHMDWG